MHDLRPLLAYAAPYRGALAFGGFLMLLKIPPILILDEATAMFDPEGEREFLEECRDVFRQRTVLLITHRPASLAVADRIVRMEDGRIVAGEARA